MKDYTIRDIVKEVMRINVDDILSRVDQGDLFRYYIGRDPDHPGLHTNPLRADENPGCGFFVNYVGKLIFYDHATKEGYDIFRAMKERYGYSFREAYFKINTDFNLGLLDEEPTPVKTIASKPTARKLIQVVQKRFTKSELAFWEEFGISYETLQLFGVVSVKFVYVNKRLIRTSDKNTFIFAWNFSKTNHIKVYIPSIDGEGKSEWISNCSLDDVQGEDMFPYLGELGILTKSYKDIMLLYELGYSAVAPQSEGGKFRDGFIESLKLTWDKLIILYDNDGEFYPKKGVSGKGKQAALKASQDHDLPFILIPDGEPKDISDYYKKHGREKTIELLNHLLNDFI
jgi:hypothetical protein